MLYITFPPFTNEELGQLGRMIFLDQLHAVYKTALIRERILVWILLVLASLRFGQFS